MSRVTALGGYYTDASGGGRVQMLSHVRRSAAAAVEIIQAVDSEVDISGCLRKVRRMGRWRGLSLRGLIVLDSHRGPARDERQTRGARVRICCEGRVSCRLSQRVRARFAA